MAVGGSGRDYDECAWPVGVNAQRIFFSFWDTDTGEAQFAGSDTLVEAMQMGPQVVRAARGDGGQRQPRPHQRRGRTCAEPARSGR